MADYEQSAAAFLRLSDAQRRALLGLYEEDDIGYHFHGLSSHGGLMSKTIPSLIRRGLLRMSDGDDVAYEVTDEGVKALKMLEQDGWRR